MKVRTHSATRFLLWQIPDLGHPAEHAVPSWIVDRIVSGDLMFNTRGGLDLISEFGLQTSAPGTFIAIDEFDQVSFITPANVDRMFDAEEPMALAA